MSINFCFVIPFSVPILIQYFLQYSRTREKRAQLAMKRTVSSLGDRIIDDEDQSENMPSGSSSDDDVLFLCNCFLIVCPCSNYQLHVYFCASQAKYQNLKLANSEMIRQSMADRFQEALAATSLSNEGFFVTASKPSG